MVHDRMWVDIGAIDAIPIRGARIVRTGAGCIAVFRTAADEAFAIDESILDGYAQGRPFDLEGYSRPVRFRMLRIFEFRDGLIARENAWFDIVAVQRQLAPPRH